MPGKTNSKFDRFFQTLIQQRTLVFSFLIISALLAFEIFNYGTTEFAMSDLLGDLKFGGMRWATILALAFCAIDFAGIARLFTPEQGGNEPKEVWYLLGAWLIAATMNAALTWWGVSIAILHHQSLGNAVIARETLLKAVPVFVAILVWMSRVLIIGTFSIAGDRLLWKNIQPSNNFRRQETRKPGNSRTRSFRPETAPGPNRRRPSPASARPAQSRSFSPAPKPDYAQGAEISQDRIDNRGRNPRSFN